MNNASRSGITVGMLTEDGYGYVQLKRGNDWGRAYVCVDPDGCYVSESDGKTYGRGHSYDRGIHVEDGVEVEIRWPDGVIEVVRVKNQASSARVGDMGRTYDTEYTLPGVEFVWRTMTFWVPLDAPGLLVSRAWEKLK